MAKRSSAPKDSGLCTAHRNMLGKSEFRWVIALILAVAAGYKSLFAPASAVEVNTARISDMRRTIEAEREERKELAKTTLDQFILLRKDIKEAMKKRP